MKNSDHLYSNLDLKKLLVPIIVEQLLSCLMGTVDTMMVSNVGSAAISAVSARQVLLVMTVLSVALTLICLVFRVPLLKLIFGKVEADVMANSQVYFLFTLLSFPFIGLYDAGASIMRAQNDSRRPMVISVISNFLNIGGNALLIFVLNMGVAGAAISTLFSRIFCAVVVIWKLRNEKEPIAVRNYLSIRPDSSTIRRILYIAIQSTVSTLGTVAIAAQAMTNILEMLNGVAAMGIGIGLMTVVGQCLGAGRKDEAVYYVKKLSWLAEAAIIFSCLLVLALTKPITRIGGMEAESAQLCFNMVVFITITKPISWVLSFIPAYGMRAAGDVKFSMITSCLTMWLCRVILCIYLCRVWGFGPIAVWIGMFADWTLRAIIFTIRFHSRKWLNHHIIS